MKNASKRVDKRAAILCAYLIHQVISNQRTANEQPKNSTSSSGVAPIPDGICPALSWAFFAFDEREIQEGNYGLVSGGAYPGASRLRAGFRSSGVTGEYRVFRH